MTWTPAEMLVVYSAGVLSFAFLLSGGSKLRHADLTLRAMRDLRVPLALRRVWLAKALPFWEGLLALSLVSGPYPLRIAGALSLGLTLIVFTFLLVKAVRRVEEVECGCFGPLSASNPVSGESIARNILLLAFVGCVALPLLRDRSIFLSVVDATGFETILLMLLWAVTLLAVLARALMVARKQPPGRNQTAVVGVPRSATPAPMSPASIARGLDPARPGELEPGESIPELELVTEVGISVPLREVAQGRAALLLFLSATCASCVEVASQVERWRREIGSVEIRVATSSTPEVLLERVEALRPITLYGALAARKSFGVQHVPAAVVLGGHWQPVVASPVAYGVDEIEGLIQGLRVESR